MELRIASAEDSAALLAIYEPYIETAVTFEYTLPSIQEFAGRIVETMAGYPYLVCQEAGQILGYAYARRAQARAAYQWNAELSVYMAPAHTGRGLGGALYRALLDLLRMQGVKTAYGVVAQPNPHSEALHLRLGFAVLGTCRKAGYKCGAWHDVIWFEKELAPHGNGPAPLTPFPELPQEQVERVLRRYSKKTGIPFAQAVQNGTAGGMGEKQAGRDQRGEFQ